MVLPGLAATTNGRIGAMSHPRTTSSFSIGIATVHLTMWVLWRSAKTVLSTLWREIPAMPANNINMRLGAALFTVMVCQLIKMAASV